MHRLNSPSHVSEPECYYVQRFESITLEEARLRLALIALVGNGSSDFPSNEASTAITAAVGLDVSEYTTTRTFSGSFLIVCNFSVARNQILAASPISMAGTNLSMPPMDSFCSCDAGGAITKGGDRDGRHPGAHLEH
jgi:hypothetical protein